MSTIFLCTHTSFFFFGYFTQISSKLLLRIDCTRNRTLSKHIHFYIMFLYVYFFLLLSTVCLLSTDSQSTVCVSVCMESPFVCEIKVRSLLLLLVADICTQHKEFATLHTTLLKNIIHVLFPVCCCRFIHTILNLFDYFTLRLFNTLHTQSIQVKIFLPRINNLYRKFLFFQLWRKDFHVTAFRRNTFVSRSLNYLRCVGVFVCEST